jgi:hypothetical protein
MKRILLFSINLFWLCGSSQGIGKIVDPRVLCSFSPGHISPLILSTTQVASDEYRQLITKMFAYAGQVDLGIFIGTSSQVPFACTGYTHAGKPAIIVNERRLAVYDRPTRVSIIAHEMGHFNDRHIDTDSPLTVQHELNADQFNGTYCSRVSNYSIEQILFPYTLIGVDSVHPKFDVRKTYVENGYQIGQRRLFAQATTDTSLSLAENFAGKLKLVITVDPDFDMFKDSKVYNIFLHVVPIDTLFTASQIIAKVDYVRYVLDPTFKTQIVTNDSPESNYEFKCTRVYGTFPVTAIIRFKDYTDLSMTNSFELPK